MVLDRLKICVTGACISFICQINNGASVRVARLQMYNLHIYARCVNTFVDTCTRNPRGSRGSIVEMRTVQNFICTGHRSRRSKPIAECTCQGYGTVRNVTQYLTVYSYLLSCTSVEKDFAVGIRRFVDSWHIPDFSRCM